MTLESPPLEIPRSAAAFDELDPVAVRIPDEAETRPAFPNRVRRPLRLDALLGESGEGLIEIVDRQRDMAVPGSDLVTAVRSLEVVGELELRAVSAGNPEEVVDCLVPDRQLAPLLEAEGFVECDRLFRIGDPVARVDQ